MGMRPLMAITNLFSKGVVMGILLAALVGLSSFAPVMGTDAFQHFCRGPVSKGALDEVTVEWHYIDVDDVDHLLDTDYVTGADNNYEVLSGTFYTGTHYLKGICERPNGSTEVQYFYFDFDDGTIYNTPCGRWWELVHSFCFAQSMVP